MAKINASDVSEKAKAKLRPTAIMGGTTSHNGKPDTDAMVKKSQAHHEANRAKRSTSDGYMARARKINEESKPAHQKYAAQEKERQDKKQGNQYFKA